MKFEIAGYEGSLGSVDLRWQQVGKRLERCWDHSQAIRRLVRVLKRSQPDRDLVSDAVRIERKTKRRRVDGGIKIFGAGLD